jgi:carbamoyl-phosphate synthase small subunit
VKRNILRLLAGDRAKVTVVPATATAEDILATSRTACSCPTAPAIRPRPASMPCRDQGAARSGKPVFGICLGHQMLGLAARREDREDARRAITAPTTR